MKILFLLFALTASAFAQDVKTAENSQGTEVQTDSNARLQAELELVDKFFCESKSLQLYMRLTYKNVGKVNIILSKSAYSSAQDTINLIDSNGKIVGFSKSIPHYFFDLSEKKLLARETKTEVERYFVVLAPGESYEITNLGKSISSDWGPGEFTLEQTFTSFQFASSLAKGSEKLKEMGVVWDKIITTNPMKFSIENVAAPINTSKCKMIGKISRQGCLISVEGKKTCYSLN